MSLLPALVVPLCQVHSTCKVYVLRLVAFEVLCRQEENKATLLSIFSVSCLMSPVSSVVARLVREMLGEILVRECVCVGGGGV